MFRTATEQRRNNAWFVLVGGALLLGFSLWKLSGQWSSSNWPEAKGRIVGVSVDSAQIREGGRRGRTKTVYRSFAKFTYVVDGELHKSSDFSVGQKHVGEHDERSDAQDEIDARYRDGQDVPVYYDPGDPDVGVLQIGETGSNRVWYILGIVGLLMLAAAIADLKGYINLLDHFGSDD